MATAMIRWTVLGLGAVAILATLLPFLPSEESWIRIWDFPRLQAIVLLLAALVATPFTLSLRRVPGLLCMAALAAALGWQLHHVWRYSPLHPIEARAVAQCNADARIGLFVANVLAGTRDAAPLLALIERIQPDLVLLVETEAWWHARLDPLRQAYPHRVERPRENGYGMHLYSRLPLVDTQVRHLVDDDVQSIKTGVVLPSGTRVDLYGLHPKPPPLEDTEQRDAELILVAAEIRAEGPPAIVAGDLNDVGWSRTTRRFQAVSGMLDPRIGRGPYATFNADWPLLRWPLDHVFFEESFWLRELAVLPDIGSDHFPLYVALCHDPDAARRQAKPQPDAEDLDAAKETIREGREAESQDAD